MSGAQPHTPALTSARLALLGHGAERTGPPILLAHLVRHLVPRCTSVTVAVARRGPLEADYRRSGAAVVSLATGREPLEPVAAALRRAGAGSAAADLQDRVVHRRLRSLVDADLVYVNAATPPTAAMLEALDPPRATPVVVHVHELDVGLRRNLSDAARHRLFARADRFVAASPWVARNLIEGHGIDPGLVTTCAEFVEVAAVEPGDRSDVRRRLGIPVDALVVGSVGLPDWRKAPDLLLHAVHRLRTTGAGLDPWVVWIGGDPASDDGVRLADEAARLGLADRLVHVRHLDRPDRLLGGLDVFALPAREDALPLAALEAAAASLPLVCFRTGGVADLCDAGAGTAVDYPDVAAFAQAIGGYLADPGGASLVGSRARAIVAADHDAEIGTARIAAVLDDVLAWSGR